MSKYILGDREPHYIKDYGSGGWCSLCLSNSSDLNYLTAIAKVIYNALNNKETEDYAYIIKFIKYRYPIAINHLNHYLKNPLAGQEDINYDFQIMQYFMQKSPGLRMLFNNEIQEAKTFCEDISGELFPGVYKISSTEVSQGDFKNDSADLFYAIGGYQCWGKGELTVSEIPYTKHVKVIYKNNDIGSRGRYEYNLLFTFVFFDRYNWNITNNNSRGVLLGGVIPVNDDFMGRFHQMGLAREYNIWGELSKNIQWAESF
ncbi:hypothetical protein ACP26C_21560 [Franconibacter helveticus 513]|uniref:hypothetical protein n=1 Tax=Franconibacter helveticus TaxID=357240 RepID=UPI000465E04E|nr:hypothetical protein [Franconibacter helveticus]